MAENNTVEQNTNNTVDSTLVNTTHVASTPTSKFGLQEKHTVGGVEYTFQFPGTKATIELLDRCKNGFNNVVDSAYYQELMDNVIVSPHTDWDYWDNHNGLREVMGLADNFLGRQL